VSLRAAFGAIVFGLVAALGIFFWTEYQTGRLSDVVAFVREAQKAGPPPLVTRPAPATPSAVPTATVASTPTAAPTLLPTTRPATALPTRPPTPTALPPTVAPTRTAGPRQVWVTADELDAELKRQVASGGLPLRNPSLRMQPPDGMILRGAVPVAIFQIPVEVEARLSVDDRGTLKVTTTRVEAVGASLPQSVATSLGQQVDALGSQAVQGALPRGVKAQRVVVEADRVTVELAGS
jgi:hypothetical protein